MKDFLVNFTTVLEKNPKVYWSIIIGIVGCLGLYIAEIIHIQNILAHLDSSHAQLQRAVLQPVAQRYQLSRKIFMSLAVLWSIKEYLKTKKMLNLKS